MSSPFRSFLATTTLLCTLLAYECCTSIFFTVLLLSEFNFHSHPLSLSIAYAIDQDGQKVKVLPVQNVLHCRLHFGG